MEWFTLLTLGPADGIHEDVVLVDLVLVMLELPLQVQQLLAGELARALGLWEEQKGVSFNSSNRDIGEERQVVVVQTGSSLAVGRIPWLYVCEGLGGIKDSQNETMAPFYTEYMEYVVKFS